MSRLDIETLALAFDGLTDDELRRLSNHKDPILCGNDESQRMFRWDGRT